MSKNVTGTIREKKGLYYAVINYYGENEERKQKWFPTKLPVRGNKKKAEAILKQVLCEFEIPISKGENVNLCVNQKIQIENTGDAAAVNVKSVISTKAAEDIQDFYDVQLERVTANTVIHYHAIIRLALCYARKMGYIKENPIEEVDKPEKNQFVGKFYNSSELSEVIRLTKNTKLELPVIFGGSYGLRSAVNLMNDVWRCVRSYK